MKHALLSCLAFLVVVPTVRAQPPAVSTDHTQQRKVQAVIDEVEKACIDRTIYMIGRKKAIRLAELVRQRKPRLVLECGTAVGYSGLWIARELKNAGGGKLISVEIDRRRAEEARANFRRAGLEKFVTVKVGDARQVARELKGPFDFAFIDCGFSNYAAILAAIEDKLAPGAVLVADNVGIGKSEMSDYLKAVRAKYDSHTEWFDVELPWAKRDAIEVSIVPTD